MKAQPPPDGAPADARSVVWGEASRAPAAVPLLLEPDPTDSRLVASLKVAHLPERAWYALAVGFAKYIEATRGRRQKTELDRLHEMVAWLRLRIARTSSERLERWPPLLEQAYHDLSAKPVLRRGVRSRTGASREGIRRYVSAAKAAIAAEREHTDGQRTPRARLEGLLADLYNPADDVERDIARESARLRVARMSDDEVENILDPGHRPTEAATLLASLLLGYAEETIERKQRRRSPATRKPKSRKAKRARRIK